MDLKKRIVAVAAAVALAIPAEGLRQQAYRDPVGIPTICFGTTRGVKMGDTATVEQCRGLLSRDMMAAVDAVDRCVPGLPTPVLAAFSDAVYNLGPIIACDTTNSTAARLLRARRFIDACQELPKWDKARLPGIGLAPLPGLAKRRAAEMALCLQPEPTA